MRAVHRVDGEPQLVHGLKARAASAILIKATLVPPHHHYNAPDVVEYAVAVVHEVEVRGGVLPDVPLKGAVVQLVEVGGDLVVEDVVVPLRHLQCRFVTCELVLSHVSVGSNRIKPKKYTIIIKYIRLAPFPKSEHSAYRTL